MDAFDALEEWVIGFRKNSRHREAGSDYFFDFDERVAYNDLHALHANLRYAAKMDDPAPSAPPPSVSKKKRNKKNYFGSLFIIEPWL